MKNYTFKALKLSHTHGPFYGAEVTMENRHTKTHYVHHRNFEIRSWRDAVKAGFVISSLLFKNKTEGWSIA